MTTIHFFPATETLVINALNELGKLETEYPQFAERRYAFVAQVRNGK